MDRRIRQRRLGARAMVAVSVIGLFAGCAADVTQDTPRQTPAVTISATPTPDLTPTPELTSTPSPTTEPVPSPTPRPSPTPTPATTVAYEPGLRALDAVEALEVKGRAPKTGYSRDLFGWRSYDFDRNGCDSRNDVLRRDLIDVTFRAGSNHCTVETGTLHDPYTATAIPFQRGGATSNDVQIDHVVALSDAWQKGAQGWPELTLVQFGNDPLNLLAVDGPTNQRKGNGDAATWLPPNREFRCEYVARQIAVKMKYGLWVTQAEKGAMVNVLASCPQQALPDDGAPTPPSDVQPVPVKTTPVPAPAPTTPAPESTTAPAVVSGPVRPSSDGSCPAEAPIKGNQGRRGWIYHVKGKSPSYSQTKALVNPQSGKCLDVPSSQFNDGQKLQIWNCNGTNAQRWNL